MNSIQRSDYVNTTDSLEPSGIDNTPSPDQSTSKIRRLFDRFVDGLFILVHHVR